MRKLFGIAILAVIGIGLLVAVIKSMLGWEDTLIVLGLSAVLVFAIFFAMWLIWGGADG